jgi:hypothetical protein
VLQAALALRAAGRAEAGGRLLGMFDMLSLPQILLSDVEHLTKSFAALAGGGSGGGGDSGAECDHCISPTCPVDYAPAAAAADAAGGGSVGGGGGDGEKHQHGDGHWCQHHHHPL